MRRLERSKRSLQAEAVFYHDVFMTEYWKGLSTTHRLVTHLVWCPKYRRRVLIGTLVKRLEALFMECCQVNRWEIHELAIQKDHVHMIIQTHPKEEIARVVQLLKGGSSKVIREEFPELQEFLWGDSLWNDGYFAESIGTKHESVMRAYMRNQNKS